MFGIGAWLAEEWSIWRWGYNERTARRTLGREIERLRNNKADRAAIAEKQAQLDQIILTYREHVEVDHTNRLIRQAIARRVHVPSFDDAAAWVEPYYQTKRALTPAAYEDLMRRVRAERQSFWHLKFNWLTLAVSVVSLLVAIAAFLKS